MLKRFAVLMVASFCIVGLLAACGGGSSNSTSSSGSSGGTASQTIQMTEMKFTPNAFTVKSGDKVTIKLENKGTVLHNFSIDSLNIKQDVQPGDSKTVTFTAPAAGTLTFYCDQPGHEAAGMKGTITVQ